MVYMFYILKTLSFLLTILVYLVILAETKSVLRRGNRVAKSQDLRIPKNKRNIHTRTIKIYDALFAARENEAKA